MILTPQYQLVGSSDTIWATNGKIKYKLLLYAKVDDDLNARIHKVSVKLILGALTGGTFYKYATEAYAKVGESSAFSVTRKPSSAWELGEFSEECLLYKSGTVIGVGSVDVNDSVTEVNLSGYFKFSSASPDYYTPSSGAEAYVGRTVKLLQMSTATNAVLSAHDFKYGDTIYIHLNPDTGYTHKLSYVFNGSGEIFLENGSNNITGKYGWDTTDLALLAPDVTEAYGYIVCSTYYNDEYIGTKNTSFKAFPGSNLAPKAVMEITQPKSFKEFYLQNDGYIRADFSKSTLLQNARIKECSVTVTYSDGTVAFSENKLGYKVAIPNNKTGVISVVGRVVDSRGLVSADTTAQVVKIEPYYTPYIRAANGNNSVICRRWSKTKNNASAGGKSVRIEAARSYCKVWNENGENVNWCKLEYRYKVTGGDYSDWIALLSESEEEDDLRKTVGDDTQFSNKENYYIQLRVIDTAGNSYSLEFLIPAEDCLVHMGANGKSIGFGQYASDETGRADFTLTPYFNSGVGTTVIYRAGYNPDGSINENDYGIGLYEIRKIDMDISKHVIFLAELLVNDTFSVNILMINESSGLYSVSRNAEGFPHMHISVQSSGVNENKSISVEKNDFSTIYGNSVVTKLSALF